jgi:hypothetical protein
MNRTWWSLFRLSVSALLLIFCCFPWVGDLKGQSPSPQELVETFYAPFEKNSIAASAVGQEVPLQALGVKITRDGRRGGAAVIPPGAKLSYDAPGNLQAEEGTVAFWWRTEMSSLRAPLTLFRANHLFESRDNFLFMELRWTGRSLRLQVLDSQQQITEVESAFNWPADPKGWTYLAFSWSKTEGLKIIINGHLTGQKETPLQLGGTLDQFAFFADQVTPYSLSSPRQNCYLDELRIYSRALKPSQIETVMQLNSNTPGPVLEVGTTDAELASRQFPDQGGLNRNSDYLTISAPAQIRKVVPLDGREGKRFSWEAVDGRIETVWPGNRLPSNQKTSLVLQLPGEPFNYLQLQGNLTGWVRIKSANHGVVWEKHLTAETGSCFFYPQPILASELQIERERGNLQEVSLFLRQSSESTATAVSNPSSGQYRFRLISADQAAGLAGVSRNQVSNLYDLNPTLIRNYVSSDRRTWMAFPEEVFKAPVPKSAAINTLNPVHLVCPPFLKNTLLEKIRIKWHPLPGVHLAGTALHISIHDPIDPWWDLMNLNYRFTEDKADEIWLDSRDMVIPAGKPVWITLSSDQPGFASNCLNGAEIELIAAAAGPDAEMAKSLEEFKTDRLLKLKFMLQPVKSASFWGEDDEARLKRQYKLAGLFINELNLLKEIFPGDPVITAYWNMTQPRQVPPDYKQPERSDPSLPLWAYQQQILYQQLQKIGSWWIKNRQTAEGGMGSGSVSDSVLISNLAPIALFDSPSSPALFDRQFISAPSARQTSDRRLALSMAVLSYLRGFPDNPSVPEDQWLTPEEAYRDRLRPLVPGALVDFGLPEVVERLMGQARDILKLTDVNSAGHRHFRSILFNWKEVLEEGNWDREEPSHHLLLQPLLLLAWYNSNPLLVKQITDSADAWLAHWQTDKFPLLSRSVSFTSDSTITRGLPSPPTLSLIWGAYRLTGNIKYLEPLELLLKNGQLELLYSMGGHWIDAIDSATYKDFILGKPRALPIWDHNLFFDENGLMARQAAYNLTGERSYVEDLQAALIKHFAQNSPFYTEAEVNAGQMTLPLAAFQQLLLGGTAVAPGVLFPGHAVSWENGGGNLAKLVLKSTSTSLKVMLFNLAIKLLDGTMRVWNLDNGTYDIVEGTDVTGDNKIDVITSHRQMTLNRGVSIPVTLRPHKLTIIEIQQTHKGVSNQQLPDLAIAPPDFVYDWTQDKGGITIHNLGGVKAPRFALVVENERHGVLFKQELEGIDAPVDLLPKTIHVSLTGFREQGTKAVYIRLDPLNKVEEVSKENNQVRIMFE